MHSELLLYHRHDVTAFARAEVCTDTTSASDTAETTSRIANELATKYGTTVGAVKGVYSAVLRNAYVGE